MLEPPVLVQLPEGAEPPAYLTPWHPEPFGKPALAADLGLDRWFVSRTGQVPENAQRVEQDTEGTVASPNDPVYAQQWALRNIAPETGASTCCAAVGDMDTDWFAAYRLVQELEAAGLEPARLTIAVLDSEMEAPANLLADLTITGYWNSNLGVPHHVTPPNCPHAIHVASIAASKAGNGLGMAGVCWNVDVLAVQVLTGCFGQQAQAASGVVYATDQGAHVINMSLQYGSEPTTVFANACQYAAQSGVNVVAAAGNYSWTHSTAVPSLFDTVIAVGAIGRGGLRPAWSNAGPQLDLAAPGDAVIGMLPNGYMEMSGTSMASPHVAGAAALLRSVYPKLTAAQARAALESTADDMGDSGWDPFYGHGRLNVYRALIAANPCYGDFNMDAVLSAADMAAFQTAFALRQHRANCTGDVDLKDQPILTAADFACFMDKFGAGCD